MALRQDLKQSFQDNLDNGGEISDIAKLIVEVYEEAVESGFDSLGNGWKNINYTILQEGIEAQMNLALETASFLQFTLMETALVGAWASATLKIPAIPAPGMSVVNSGIVTSSLPVGTTPLVVATSSLDPITNKFYSMFTRHARTLNFNYIGLATAGTPPPAVTVPVSSFTVK